MQLSAGVLQSIVFALFASQVSGSAIPNAEQLVLNCEKVESSKDVKSSSFGGDRSHLSFLDRYYGPILDNLGVQQVASVGGKPKKSPIPVSDAASLLLVKDQYDYPDKDDLRDLNGSAVLYRGGEFGGVNTFAHLPYVDAFSSETLETEKFDIAVLGAPFDTGVSYRPGARFGPDGVRAGSRRLAPAYSVYDGFDPYGNWARVVDVGSVPVTPMDNRVALDQLYRAERAVGKYSTTDKNAYKTPKIFTIGGDHTITLPALRGAFENWGQIAVIHFDSHLDTWDPYYFGGNVTEYQSINHGTYLHWAHEKGLLAPDACIHAAIRGPYPGPQDVKHDIDCGFDRILARDIDKLGADEIIKRIKERVGDYPVYISVDVDSMDPSTAPASGTVEPGGWTSRELLTILDGLEGLKVVGGDVVEVSPPYDTAAEITSIVAAQVADSIISLMIMDSNREAKEAGKN